MMALVIVAGLTCKLLSPAPQAPTGKLVDVGGTNLHVVASGTKDHRPTVVIEAGAGLPTDYFHWIDRQLRDSLRVIRYDRAGLGHSDEVSTPRDPETIATELHTLLQRSGESPPYILMGHSMGGPYIRVFGQLYPDEVAAMFFLDATHHDQVAQFGAPEESAMIFKVYIALTRVQVWAADLGIYMLYEKLMGNPYGAKGLPDEINDRVKDLLANGKSFRAYRAEMKNYHSTLERSGQASDFGDMPIRSFHAIKDHESSEKSAVSVEEKGYLDFEDLSTNGQRIDIVGDHTSIFTKEENAQIISNEVLRVVRELREHLSDVQKN